MNTQNILVIDNYDSFTYNLVQYLGELGAELRVFRNDQVAIDDIRLLSPSHIVISPGPGTPERGGISGIRPQDTDRRPANHSLRYG